MMSHPLPPLQYITQCKNLFNEMVRLVDSAKTHVYHVAVALDLDSYDQRLLRAYERALDRGVKVHICTSDGIYENNCSRLSDVTHPNLVLVEQVVVDDVPESQTMLGLVMKRIAHPSATTASYRGQHIRFICNETDMLMCGGNGDMASYGGTCENHDDVMYETGVLVRGFATSPSNTPLSWIHRLFSAISSATIHTDDTLLSQCPAHIHYKGKRTHDWLCEKIRMAKHEIYMENQYTVSYQDMPCVDGTESTENQIMVAIADRVKRAVRDKEEFHITYMCNETFPDETGVAYAALNVFFAGSIRYLRSQVKCDDATFQRYVTILVPNVSANTLIHSKVWVFDRETIMCGSSNIMDRSFSDAYGDYEMSWIFDSSTYGADVIEDMYHAIRSAAPTHQTYQYTTYHVKPMAHHGFGMLAPIVDALIPSYDWRKQLGSKQPIERAMPLLTACTKVYI